MTERIIGILGGMGPEATWDLYGRIIKITPVKKDSDHHHVIIDSNSKIPDRTLSILGKGESPVNQMVASGKRLEQAGASFILIPCMTAHYFIQHIQDAVSIPVVNAFLLLQKHLHQWGTIPDKTAVIATSGSIASGLYQHYLSEFQMFIPSEDVQEQEVMDIIFGPKGIKASGVTPLNIHRLENLFQYCQEQGADVVIAGCTEIGLAVKDHPMPLPVIDPLDLLASEGHRMALNSNS